MITDKRYLNVLTQPEGTFKETGLRVEDILDDVRMLRKAEKQFDDHVSFSGLQAYANDEEVAQDVADHIDECGLCQSMVAAFNPPSALVDRFLKVATAKGAAGYGSTRVTVHTGYGVIVDESPMTSAAPEFNLAANLAANLAVELVSLERPMCEIQRGNVSIRIEHNSLGAAQEVKT